MRLLALFLLALPFLVVAAPPSYVHYYARANLVGHGINAHVEFFGTNQPEPTFVKVRILGGLLPGLSPTGTFIYHIHTNPVPPDGNCTGTLAHLDPLNVTESDTCNPAYPMYCQEGDLSGKHGALNGTASGMIPAFGYSDDFVRFFPADMSLLGRSVVLHSSNKTRLACGNITSGIDGTADFYQVPTNRSSTFVTSFPKTAPVQPAVIITPDYGPNGSTTNRALPRPVPLPALGLSYSLNVKLVETTMLTYVNNVEVNATLPGNAPSSDPPPFPGWVTADWA